MMYEYAKITVKTGEWFELDRYALEEFLESLEITHESIITDFDIKNALFELIDSYVSFDDSDDSDDWDAFDAFYNNVENDLINAIEERMDEEQEFELASLEPKDWY